MDFSQGLSAGAIATGDSDRADDRLVEALDKVGGDVYTIYQGALDSATQGTSFNKNRFVQELTNGVFGKDFDRTIQEIPGDDKKKMQEIYSNFYEKAKEFADKVEKRVAKGTVNTPEHTEGIRSFVQNTVRVIQAASAIVAACASILLANPTIAANVTSSVTAAASLTVPEILVGSGLVVGVGGLIASCTKRTKNGLDTERDKVVQETDKQMKAHFAKDDTVWAKRVSQLSKQNTHQKRKDFVERQKAEKGRGGSQDLS